MTSLTKKLAESTLNPPKDLTKLISKKTNLSPASRLFSIAQFKTALTRFAFPTGSFLCLGSACNKPTLWNSIPISEWEGGSKRRFWQVCKTTGSILFLQCHYAFEMTFCNPGKGNKKGLIENLLGWSRKNLLVPVLRVDSIDELNQKLYESCLKYREYQIKGRTMTVCEMYNIEKRQNIIMIGNPGSWKSHLSIDLGLKAIKEGFNVKFYTAASLATALVEAREFKSLGKLEKQIHKADLLILDELSYLSFNRYQSELLFKVISDRSEKASVIVTTNLPFSKRTELFENPTMITALVDRLTFRSHVLNMNGESFRKNQSKVSIN